MLVIDEKSSRINGVTPEGLYIYDGNIYVISSSVNISCPLLITGSVHIGGGLIALNTLYVTGPMGIGQSVICHGSLTADYLSIGGYLAVNGNLKVNRTMQVRGAVNVFQDMDIDGLRTKTYMTILGISNHSIFVYDTHIRIGCLLKTKEEWKNIYDKVSKDASGAYALGDLDGEIYKYKDILVKLL